MLVHLVQRYASRVSWVPRVPEQVFLPGHGKELGGGGIGWSSACTHKEAQKLCCCLFYILAVHIEAHVQNLILNMADEHLTYQTKLKDYVTYHKGMFPPKMLKEEHQCSLH